MGSIFGKYCLYKYAEVVQKSEKDHQHESVPDENKTKISNTKEDEITLKGQKAVPLEFNRDEIKNQEPVTVVFNEEKAVISNADTDETRVPVFEKEKTTISTADIDEIKSRFLKGTISLKFKESIKNKDAKDAKYFIKVHLKTQYPLFTSKECDKYANEIYDLIKEESQTYVHEYDFPNHIHRPWFKEHEIGRNSVSPPMINVYSQLFVVVILMSAGIFIGKYVYRKFMKNSNQQKVSEHETMKTKDSMLYLKKKRKNKY